MSYGIIVVAGYFVKGLKKGMCIMMMMMMMKRNGFVNVSLAMNVVTLAVADGVRGGVMPISAVL
eukprot:scaffold60274_cov19-Cyclotella_meneghiniana.AAC.1